MAEVLIVGNGGREHALELAIQASKHVERVERTTQPQKALQTFSTIDKPLVIIGPEQPLVDGLADELRHQGYPVFGASKAAAEYEASKSFATLMMRRAGVVHADTYITSIVSEADDYIHSHEPDSYVIKADGLGKGKDKNVVLPHTVEQALTVSRALLDGSAYGQAGTTINFQERHSGPEVSAMIAVGDNDEFVILPIAQDHKRLLDGDNGPNTGGMGAYAPVPPSILSAQQYAKIVEAVERTLTGMREFDQPFERGLLYAGFILSKQRAGDPVIIEYNVRFGDPEAQVILPLLLRAGVDVYRLLRSAAEGNLQKPKLDLSRLGHAALTVCLAAPGYPENPKTGDVIYGLGQKRKGVTTQLAGVHEGKTAGGRVVYVTATGKTIPKARRRAYGAIDTERLGVKSRKIGFPGMSLRTDVGDPDRLQ